MKELNPITSRTFDNLRLPLILGVLLIHSAPTLSNLNALESLDARFLVSFLCNNFVRVSVPLFFFISGYLFFFGVNHFTKEIYKSKVKSRTKSLLVPYLLWNLIVYVLFTFKTIINGEATPHYLLSNILPAFVGQFPSPVVNILEPYNFPFDFPLWFLRDLYVFVLISPVFYYLIKKAGAVIVGILSFAFISGLWPQILFFNINGVLFFSLGAFLALRKTDLTELILRNPRICQCIVFVYPFLIFFDSFTFIYFESVYHYARTIQIFWGVAAVFIIFTKISSKTGYRSKISGQAVFALFVMHGIYDIYLSKLSYLFDLESFAGCLLFIAYDFCGMIILSWAVYCLLKYISPKLTSVLFGKRNIPRALK